MKNSSYQVAIPLFPMDRKIAKHRKLISEAMTGVINKSTFIFGDRVLEFESKFSKYLGVESTVAVANGTDALEIAIQCLNLPRGSDIATVANAGHYSSGAILKIGHRPIYIDIEQSTQLTNLSHVEKAIDLGARAVVITHLYGNPILETQSIAQLCKSKGVYLIEDCAQAHGASIDGRLVGTFGDLATFSFYPTKNLGAVGDAGAVVTSTEYLGGRLSSLRNYGWGKKYEIEYSGGRNSRMDELQAAVLIELLEFLDAENAIRVKHSTRILTGISNPFIQTLQSSIGSVFHLFVIMTDWRDQLVNFLNTQGIQTGIHYPILDTQQSSPGVQYNTANLEESLKSVRRILTLPMHPFLTDSEVDLIICALNEFRPSK